MRPLELNAKNLEEQIAKNLKGLVTEVNDFDILIGIPAKSGDNSKSKMTVAQYAYLNEMGRIGGAGVVSVPARPFLSNTFNGTKKMTALKIFMAILKDMNQKNMKAHVALEQIALLLAGLVQDNITSGNWQPNSPVTIAKKGSSKPLIDTGTMRRAVTGWLKRRSNKAQ